MSGQDFEDLSGHLNYVILPSLLRLLPAFSQALSQPPFIFEKVGRLHEQLPGIPRMKEVCVNFRCPKHEQPRWAPLH